jgi:hypothetical protein
MDGLTTRLLVSGSAKLAYCVVRSRVRITPYRLIHFERALLLHCNLVRCRLSYITRSSLTLCRACIRLAFLPLG